jgi:Domain of unknown function (DUF4198)
MRDTRLFSGRLLRSLSRRILPLLALACLLAPRPAFSHEFWIEPERFRTTPGAKDGIRLHVGQYFKGNSIPWLKDNYEDFYYSDARGTEKIRGVLGDDPAGTITVRAAGRIWIVLRSMYFELTYDKPGEFDAFLVKEGIDHLVPRDERKVPVKETYSRCAKSLLLAGPARPASAPDRAFGLPLEIVAETDPYAGKPTEFKVKLLYRGAPLPGALVIAFHKAVPDRRLEARTDASGRARLPVDRQGVWLLNAVHLLPASKKSGARWETMWSSLTFEIP